MNLFKFGLFFISVLAVSSCVCAEEGIDYARERRIMVDSQIVARGIKDKRILDAVGKIERHKFVPEGMRKYAYEDVSLPISEGEAIPPAYFVSLVAQISELKGKEKVLEVGIESGYEAAVLAELSGEVYCVEPSQEIALQSEQRLRASGYNNIRVKTGRIEEGWPESAPYDVIVVTNMIDNAPQQLIDQLADNGRIIMPLREYWGKKLVVITKKTKGKSYELAAMAVVPVVGEIPSEKAAVAAAQTAPDPKETTKWEAVKGSKWMNKKK